MRNSKRSGNRNVLSIKRIAELLLSQANMSYRQITKEHQESIYFC